MKHPAHVNLTAERVCVEILSAVAMNLARAALTIAACVWVIAAPTLRIQKFVDALMPKSSVVFVHTTVSAVKRIGIALV